MIFLFSTIKLTIELTSSIFNKSISAPRSLSNIFCCWGTSTFDEAAAAAPSIAIFGGPSRSVVTVDGFVGESIMTWFVVRLPVSNRRSTPEREYTSPQEATVEDRQIYFPSRNITGTTKRERHRAIRDRRKRSRISIVDWIFDVDIFDHLSIVGTRIRRG